MKKKIILLSSLLLMLMGLQSCTAQSNKSDTFDAGGGHEFTVYPVKHGSLRITFDTLEIEVDPVGKLESATDYSTFPKADIILLTHSNFDHFDPEALLKLITPGKTLIITNDDCGNRLQEDLRFKDSKVVRMHNQESYIALGRVKVEAVPAYNTSKGKEQYHPKGRDNGFVLTLGNKKIYCCRYGRRAGDGESEVDRHCLPALQSALHHDPCSISPCCKDVSARCSLSVSLQ